MQSKATSWLVFPYSNSTYPSLFCSPASLPSCKEQTKCSVYAVTDGELSPIGCSTPPIRAKSQWPQLFTRWSLCPITADRKSKRRTVTRCYRLLRLAHWSCVRKRNSGTVSYLFNAFFTIHNSALIALEWSLPVTAAISAACQCTCHGCHQYNLSVYLLQPPSVQIISVCSSIQFCLDSWIKVTFLQNFMIETKKTPPFFLFQTFFLPKSLNKNSRGE